MALRVTGLPRGVECVRRPSGQGRSWVTRESEAKRKGNQPGWEHCRNFPLPVERSRHRFCMTSIPDSPFFHLPPCGNRRPSMYFCTQVKTKTRGYLKSVVSFIFPSTVYKRICLFVVLMKGRVSYVSQSLRTTGTSDDAFLVSAPSRKCFRDTWRWGQNL